MEDERLKERFHELAAKYSEETAHFSFSKPDHPAYQELVKMGEDVGPLFMECLIEKRHSPWLMLEMIDSTMGQPSSMTKEAGLILCGIDGLRGQEIVSYSD